MTVVAVCRMNLAAWPQNAIKTAPHAPPPEISWTCGSEHRGGWQPHHGAHNRAPSIDVMLCSSVHIGMRARPSADWAWAQKTTVTASITAVSTPDRATLPSPRTGAHHASLTGAASRRASEDHSARTAAVPVESIAEPPVPSAQVRSSSCSRQDHAERSQAPSRLPFSAAKATTCPSWPARHWHRRSASPRALRSVAAVWESPGAMPGRTWPPAVV